MADWPSRSPNAASATPSGWLAPTWTCRPGARSPCGRCSSAKARGGSSSPPPMHRSSWLWPANGACPRGRSGACGRNLASCGSRSAAHESPCRWTGSPTRITAQSRERWARQQPYKPRRSHPPRDLSCKRSHLPSTRLTHMCGIVGVHGHPQAAELTRLGLYSLQHRGQESAGIVVIDDVGQAKSVRALGLVSDGLDHDQVGALDGSVAIGHTRYSTTGSSTIENAQPALARFRGGHIALAHNGNITNATELRLELEDRGSIFSSTMDSEVLVHRLAMSTSEPPAAKLADALRGVEGAYCVLVVIGDTLLAARDPRGWRPLVLGTLDGSTIVASETCALDIMGAHYDREIAPGEIVSIGRTGVHSTFPLPHQALHRCVFEHVYFS